MPLQHRVLADRVERVPAHVRDLQVLVARRDLHDVARDPVEAVGVDVLAAARRHQLHADADAEERPRLVAHRLGHRLDHAVDRVEAACGNRRRRRRPAARRDRRGTPRRDRRVTHDLLAVPAFARRALERLRGGVQIARAVIDDRQRSPLIASRLRETGRSRRARGKPARAQRRRDVGGGSADEIDAPAQPDVGSHASKKRRSAASRSSATDETDLTPARRDKLQRRKSWPLRCRSNGDQTAIASKTRA